jgi:SpoVK/Ycf46/Vps4 family AAA+-type ATPase
MKTELLTRLVRAIKQGSQADLQRLAQLIVEEERRQGHARVADKLQALLDRQIKGTGTTSDVSSNFHMDQLPVSRRTGMPLATIMPFEQLRHHMVLPENVEARFQRVENEFASRERLNLFGFEPRKKILLYGPPGCGKTLGAERLAWKLGLSIAKVRFDLIMSSYLGESATNLRDIFEFGKTAPRLLLLEECDSIAKARDCGNDVGEMARVVNSLLGLMEEYSAPGLLVATTNLSKALDPALFRRFDDVIEIPAPGEDEIVRLLRSTLSGIKVEENINWRTLAVALKGTSAAHVVQVAQDAAKAGILAGEKVLKCERLEATVMAL